MKKQKLLDLAKRYWPLVAIVLIIALSLHIRLLDYRWSYLRNIDSYVYYRQMDMITQNNGVLPSYDPYVLAPAGNTIETNTIAGNLYVYFGAYSYMFFHMFMQDMQLWQFLIWFPPFIASLMAIPMYFIGKQLYDRRAGVLAAFFVVFDISIMARTLGGDPDSDGIVLLVPLVIMAVYLHVYKKMKNGNVKLPKFGLYSVVLGVLLFIWSNAWGGGFWYIIWLITGFAVLTMIMDMVRTRKIGAIAVKKFLLLNILIAFVIMLGLSAAIGSDYLSVARATVQGPFEFAAIKDETVREYPNVYVSVAELQPPGDARSIIQRITPVDINANPAAALISPFFLMIYALVYLGYSYYKKRQHLDTFLLLLIWFVGPFMSTTIAIRFSILFSAPLAIGSAIILSKMIRMGMLGEKLEE